MGRAIGIDLGTTFCVAAFPYENGAKIIPDQEGENLLPSVYAELDKGRGVVGKMALEHTFHTPEKGIFSIKRKMGTDFRVKINNRSYSPQEISAFILKKIKNNAENFLGEIVDRAVITVPAYFDNRAREATKEAGAIAGLDVMRIINEPTAAALAYGLDRQDIQTILVWDLGGGTFDVSILELDRGFFKVIAVNGDNMLGGDDFDQQLVDHMADLILSEFSVDIKKDLNLYHYLKISCEQVKRELSMKDEAFLFLPKIPLGNGKFQAFKKTVTQELFEALTGNLAKKLILPTEVALKDSGFSKDEIDRVILVGGSTRMPCIRRLAREVFLKEPYIKINPDEVVGIGAALQAGILTREIKNIVLVDVTPLSLGIESQGGVFTKIIQRNSTIPALASQIFTTAMDNQTTMDFNIFQGERKMTIDNVTIGSFQLAGIEPLPRGQAKVEVCFKIDTSGIVHVSALDLQTEEREGIKLDSIHKLTDVEVKRAVEEASAYARSDREKLSKVKIIITAENKVTDIENFLDFESEGIPESRIQALEVFVTELQSALEQEDLNEINEIMTAMEEDSQKLLEK